MEPLPVDLFATKGVEYVLVLAFLAALILFWRLLTRPPASARRSEGPRAGAPSGWFHFPGEAFFHPGHGWALPASDGTVRVGIDDFAQKLVGPPSAVALPAVGAHVEQGSRGSRLCFGEDGLDLLSPLDGQVVERNEAVLEDPELINRDPYGDGWLLKLRPTRLEPNLGNLLHGGATAAWMAAAEESLRARMAPGLGTVLQDGGVPVVGIAKNVFGDEWIEVARDLLRTH